MAKQAICRSNQKCYTWKPSAEIVREVIQGTCHKRYVERLKISKELQKINVQVTDREENSD